MQQNNWQIKGFIRKGEVFLQQPESSCKSNSQSNLFQKSWNVMQEDVQDMQKYSICFDYVESEDRSRVQQKLKQEEMKWAYCEHGLFPFKKKRIVYVILRIVKWEKQIDLIRYY